MAAGDLPVRSLAWPREGDRHDGDVPAHEWLVTNGLGGYASGTVVGAITRRFHGLLIAALPAPLGRVMLLNHISERLRFRDYTSEWLGAHGSEGQLAQAEGARHLVEFRLEGGLPVWRYAVRDLVIERALLMPYGQNTVHVTYRIVEGQDSVRLTLRPLLGFRPHEAPVDRAPADYTLTARDRRIEIKGDAALPPLRLVLHATEGAFTVDDYAISDVGYLLEKNRGYEPSGPLWSAGYFRAQLAPGRDVTLIASTEAWETIAAINPADAVSTEHDRRSRLIAVAHPAARSGPAAELVLAADQFLVRPSSRADDEARARASGGEARTVIAGYHWFTDWGRDTMISLEGLTLTDRPPCAKRGDILRTFAHYVRDGLIPNMFPEGEREGLYHTADATLWFFHAIDRYVRRTGDRDHAARMLLPTLVGHRRSPPRRARASASASTRRRPAHAGRGGLSAHVDGRQGGRLGRHAAPRQGGRDQRALVQRAAPARRRGSRDEGERRGRARSLATRRRASESFNAASGTPHGGYLYDVVDGEAAATTARAGRTRSSPSRCRHPVLDRARWEPVLDVVRRSAADASRPALAGARSPRLQAEVLRRPARPRRRLSPGHGLGAGSSGPSSMPGCSVHPDDRAGARALARRLRRRT